MHFAGAYFPHTYLYISNVASTMVLPLIDLCLISLRDAVEYDRFPYIRLLPPGLRQSILNAILMRGSINNPRCLSLFSSVEFLQGFTSLNLQCGIVDDRQYLTRITDTLCATTENGDTIGKLIKALNLNLYGSLRYNYEDDTSSIDQLNLHEVTQLIGQCAAATSLSLNVLQIAEDRTTDLEVLPAPNVFDHVGLLNVPDPEARHIPVLENLTALTIGGSYRSVVVVTASLPIIHFKQLTSLYLVNGAVDTKAWEELLHGICGTLSTLHLENVAPRNFASNVYGQWTLPFPLPRLQHLILMGCPTRCTAQFVDNLLECKNVKYVFLRLSAKKEEKKTLELLSSIEAVLEVEVKRDFSRSTSDDEAVLQTTMQLEIFRSLKKFTLNASSWNWRLTSILKTVSLCENLTAFHFYSPTYFDPPDPATTRRELEKAKLSLGILFSDRNRAEKLTALTLVGDYDYAVIKSVFQNCINLESCSVSFCPQLEDEHLLEWVSNGAQPAYLTIHNCDGITDMGLEAILKSSGLQLLEISIKFCAHVTDGIWRSLIGYCPRIRAVCAGNIPRFLRNALHQKCLTKPFLTELGLDKR